MSSGMEKKTIAVPEPERDSKDKTPMMAQLMLALTLNVVSSVGVIFVNKRMVFMSAGFHFGTALTIIHFLVTTLGCIVFAKIGYFDFKRLELSKVLSISLAFCGYVVFNNLSLLTNSVAVYQISKILCTPVIVAVEWVVYSKFQTTETLLALVPVCLGIVITVYSDSEISAIGLFWCALAIIANSFYTIWGKTKQTELNVSPMQILSYQAPMSACILLLTLPFMDPWKELTEYEFTPHAASAIFISCIFAFGVNFSFFLFVGQTSPLTMNVVGYLKTCLVFMGGFIFFESKPTVQNVMGIVMTMLGLAMYTKAKMAPSAPTQKHINRSNTPSPEDSQKMKPSQVV